jgi:hypothetical protein
MNRLIRLATGALALGTAGVLLAGTVAGRVNGLVNGL